MSDLTDLLLEHRVAIRWDGFYCACGEEYQRRDVYEQHLAEYIEELYRNVRAEVWAEAYGTGAADEFTAIDLAIPEYPHAARVNPYG